MTYEQLELECRQIIRDSTLDDLYRGWLNDCIEELAGEYEFPGLKLRVPAQLAITPASYLYNLSAATHVTTGYVYQRRVFRISSTAFPQGLGLEPNPLWIEDTDPLHTQTGDSVQRVAVEGDQILVFPLATDTLNVWFYRKPIPMVNPTDTPDGIEAAFHYRVLVPMVVLRGFRLYPELISEIPGDNTKSLAWWTQRLNAGLYGDTVQIGLIQALQKNERVGTPRLRGAPMGSNLGGRFW
jgi:hypothetical protein